MRISLTWDEDRTEKLKTLWAEGLSASKIADKLGENITRNAVIGKASRLKLKGRATSQRRKPTVKRVPANNRPRTAKPRQSAWQQHLAGLPAELPPAIVEQPVPLHQRRTVETVEAHDCRWPIGDPQDADFHFCGAKKLEGLPYCECHARRAFSRPTGASAPHFIGMRSRLTGALVKRMTNSVNLLEDA